MDKKKLIIALGTNVHKCDNMIWAKAHLFGLFGDDIIFTLLMDTEPIGMESEMFTNCLATAYTTLELEEIEQNLKYIEQKCHDTIEKRAKNIVEMDIDILEYDGRKFHAKDWERPYVKELMEMEGFDFLRNFDLNEKYKKA